MPFRRLLALAIPLACAVLFARLGVWQLSRLTERQAFNAVLAARLNAPPTPVTALPADTAQGHYRRVSARGTYLYDREVVWGGRSRQGSPGVNLLTPLRLAGGDTVVMVNRGWAYSPDAAMVDRAHWRERDTVTVAGYAETYPASARPNPPSATKNGTVPPGVAGSSPIYALNRTAVEQAAGIPLAPYILIQTSDSVVHADSVPVRLGLPTLDEGPHRSYAIQWFSFAAIAIVGGVALFRRTTGV